MKSHIHLNLCCYQNMIGQTVQKLSGKPFKSGAKFVKVSGVIPHPVVLGEYAFTFENDDSYVSCYMCEQTGD